MKIQNAKSCQILLVRFDNPYTLFQHVTESVAQWSSPVEMLLGKLKIPADPWPFCVGLSQSVDWVQLVYITVLSLLVFQKTLPQSIAGHEPSKSFFTWLDIGISNRLKRIETPNSLCCDFRGYKTFTTRWSASFDSSFESKFEPLPVIWQSL